MKRFLCSIIVLTMVFSLLIGFGISASAADTQIIKAGTYRFNDVLDLSTYVDNNTDYVEIPLAFSTPNSVVYDENDVPVGVNESASEYSLFVFGWTPLGDVAAFGYGNSPSNNTLFYSNADYSYWNYLNVLREVYELDKIDVLNGFGRTIIIADDTQVDDTFATWFSENTVPLVGTTYEILSGYYRFKGVPTLTYESVASIGDGNEIIYPMPEGTASVSRYNDVTYINDITFRLAGLTDNGYTLQVGYYDPNHNTIFVRVHTIVYDGLLYTIYNDDAESFSHFVIPTDVEVDELGKTLFNDTFNYFADPNVDLSIADMLVTLVKSVVQALSVDIFGYFSLLDVIKVFIGGTFVVWLLKLLAGG